MTPEDDSDRDADASNHEPVINSTPPAIATCTVTAVAASNDTCEVCLIEPRDRVALVPCGHTRFCSSCADAVASMDAQFAERQRQAFCACSCDKEQHNNMTVILTVAVFSGS